MTTKLKDLSVTSVDLVDQGANPDAHVCLFKRKEDVEDVPEADKEAQQQNTGEEPKQPPSGEIEKEESDTMRIDKSKMTPEEQATLADFEKRYGIQDEPGATPPGSETQPQGAVSELHPDVAKALADFQALTKRQSEEMEELRKSLEMERLTETAGKYEILGKNAPELAEKLYRLKKAGGSVYDDYVALLDESLTVLNKSGMFREVGSNRQGTAGATQELGIKAAELAKSNNGSMTHAEAVVKAFETNPELAARYEQEYMERARG